MSTTTTKDKTLLTALLQRHRSDQRHDCGARTQEMPCEGSRHGHTHVRHCTQEPGHGGQHQDGQHQDALHCWSFKRFDEDVVIGYEPRDLSSCRTCDQPWPCSEAEFLQEWTSSSGDRPAIAPPATALVVAERILAAKGPITARALHQLVYYCQAWRLALDGTPMFDEAIEAQASGAVVLALLAVHGGGPDVVIEPGFSRIDRG